MRIYALGALSFDRLFKKHTKNRRQERIAEMSSVTQKACHTPTAPKGRERR